MKERRETLELLIEYANTALADNIELNKTAKGWIKNKVEKNIINLKNIISDLKFDLKSKNLQEFNSSSEAISNYKNDKKSNEEVAIDLMPHMRKMLAQTTPFFVQYKIAVNTVKNSIDIDINNAIHLNIKNVFNISLGLETPEILVQHIPDMVSKTKEKIFNSAKYLKKTSELERLSIKAFELSENKDYTASNILLITIIEAFTLKFLEIVYAIQNPNATTKQIANKIYNEHGSLERLLKEINLEPDFKISYSDTQIKYADINYPKITEAANRFRLHLKTQRELESSIPELLKLTTNESLTVEEKHQKLLKKITRLKTIGEQHIIQDLEESILIPITVRLNFLRRRMYEDRNLLVHGQFDKIENTWKNYLFLNGLFKLGEVILDYNEQRNTA